MVAALRALRTFGRLRVTYAIDPLFSYRTFASVGAAVAGLMVVLLVRSELLEAAGSWKPIGLHEGAEARDGLADDQVLHLERAFVGVERFGIREEACDVVVGDDAVAAEQLPRPRDGLAAPGRAERLRERRVGVRQLSFDVQLGRAGHQTLRGRDVADHPGEEILYQLERADRLAELQPLLGVPERVLVGAHRAPRRHPRDGVARHLQHPRGVAERVAPLEAVR